MPAPITLFTFNRPRHTAQTLAALAADPLASESDLIVYSDGPRTDAEAGVVDEVRALVSAATGFRSVSLRARDANAGLKRSIIDGVTELVNDAGRIIVLEDDMVVGPDFLTYQNRALDHFADVPEVWHISGWTYPIDPSGLGDAFLWRMMNCWGWATWADRWAAYDPDPGPRLSSWDAKTIHRFNLDGAEPDNWRQMQLNASGEIVSWDVFWYATIFERGGLCLTPARSLLKNIGTDGSGTHFTQAVDVKQADLHSQSIDHAFPADIAEDAHAVARVKAHLRRTYAIGKVERGLRKLARLARGSR